MNFATPRRRATFEASVPMINVVFLLLIFFLMSAQIAPPDPFDVAPPEAADGQSLDEPAALYLGVDGALGYGDARGEAVWAALAGHAGVLVLRADGRVSGAHVADLLARLSALGIDDVVLTVQSK